MEDRDLEGPLQPGRDPHPGELQVEIGRRRGDAAVIEFGAVEGDAPDDAVLDREQPDRAREDIAAMQRLDRESAILAGPEQAARHRANPGILVIGQVGVAIRQVGRDHRHQRPARQVARGLDDQPRIEGLPLGDHGLHDRRPVALGQSRRRRQKRRGGDSGRRAFDELTTSDG